MPAASALMSIGPNFLSSHSNVDLCDLMDCMCVYVGVQDRMEHGLRGNLLCFIIISYKTFLHLF